MEKLRKKESFADVLARINAHVYGFDVNDSNLIELDGYTTRE